VTDRAGQSRARRLSVARLTLACSSFALVAAACAGGDGAAPTFTIPVASAVLPSSTAGPTPPAASNLAPQTVTLVLKEYSITPAAVTIKAGTPIIFVAQNEGTIDHALVISGGGVNLATKDFAFQPGTSEEIAATLAPGTYTYSCPVDGHAGLGMKGTITVTP